MKAKFKQFQLVIVDGSATGYGDLIGWISEVELIPILGEPYYSVRVYSPHVNRVYVAERFIRDTIK